MSLISSESRTSLLRDTIAVTSVDLPWDEIDLSLQAALAEDVGQGDVTSEAVAPEVQARGTLLAKEPGIFAGAPIFLRVFELLAERQGETVDAQVAIEDGSWISPGDGVLSVTASARTLLVGERTALNFVQRLSGIATATRRFVDAAAGGARILDTRKTTPGLRLFERYAVRAGGGENHRFGLFDQAMVKNNHVDLAQADPGLLVQRIRSRSRELTITAEARNEAEALSAVRGGADVVLLDNMTPEEIEVIGPRLRALARELGAEIELEASGGIDLETVGRFARTGVERISVGALTHSAAALDLSLSLERLP